MFGIGRLSTYLMLATECYAARYYHGFGGHDGRCFTVMIYLNTSCWQHRAIRVDEMDSTYPRSCF